MEPRTIRLGAVLGTNLRVAQRGQKLPRKLVSGTRSSTNFRRPVVGRVADRWLDRWHGRQRRLDRWHGRHRSHGPCAPGHGGVVVRVGLDDGSGAGTADDGVLHPDEVDEAAVICEP
jgi:hypothetical protein